MGKKLGPSVDAFVRETTPYSVSRIALTRPLLRVTRGTQVFCAITHSLHGLLLRLYSVTTKCVHSKRPKFEPTSGQMMNFQLRVLVLISIGSTTGVPAQLNFFEHFERIQNQKPGVA